MWVQYAGRNKSIVSALGLAFLRGKDEKRLAVLASGVLNSCGSRADTPLPPCHWHCRNATRETELIKEQINFSSWYIIIFVNDQWCIMIYAIIGHLSNLSPVFWAWNPIFPGLFTSHAISKSCKLAMATSLDPDLFCSCRGERAHSQTRKHWDRECYGNKKGIKRLFLFYFLAIWVTGNNSLVYAACDIILLRNNEVTHARSG